VSSTDTRARSGAAKREILPRVAHRQPHRLNKRAETSHQPTRHREGTVRQFQSAGHARRFLSAFGPLREAIRADRGGEAIDLDTLLDALHDERDHELFGMR
jgi:putative transposase